MITSKIEFKRLFGGGYEVVLNADKNQSQEIQTLFEMVGNNDGKLFTVDIKVRRKNKSINANNYFWQLCGELAAKNNSTAVEIYRKYIELCEVCTTFDIAEKAVKTLFHSWRLHGLGWFGEIVDDGEEDGFKTVKLYYGSSLYNAKQMAKLIDYAVTDCKELGIETMTPGELDHIKNTWDNSRDNMLRKGAL